MDLAIKSRLFIDQLPKIAHSPAQLEMLFDAASFRVRLLDEIAKAKSRIYLVALYLENDEAGRSILDALYQAKQQNPNLDIKVLVDWHRAQRGLIGSQKSEGNAALYCEYTQRYEHKIEILGVPVRNREIFGVLHLKGFILDDTVIYSGASLNDVYLAQKGRYRYDRYHLFHNPYLANCMANFVSDVLAKNEAVNTLCVTERAETKALKPAIKKFRNTLQKAHYQFVPQQINENQIGLTPLVGLGKRANYLNTQICNLISSAQEEVIICTPYFNPPRNILKVIRNALRRGINVSLIVGDKKANDFYISPEKEFKTISAIPYLYEINLRNFAKRNNNLIKKELLKIHLWEHDSNSFHLKGAWVDQNYMLLTGNNLNPRAWKLDLENAILIHDKQRLLHDHISQELHNILKHTHRIDSYHDIAHINTYPSKVQKLLKRIRRIKADHLLNQIL